MPYLSMVTLDGVDGGSRALRHAFLLHHVTKKGRVQAGRLIPTAVLGHGTALQRGPGLAVLALEEIDG